MTKRRQKSYFQSAEKEKDNNNISRLAAIQRITFLYDSFKQSCDMHEMMGCHVHEITTKLRNSHRKPKLLTQYNNHRICVSAKKNNVKLAVSIGYEMVRDVFTKH